MNQRDWKCPGCGTVMEPTEHGHMLCPKGHSKLRRLWGIKDLPLTARYDYKRFTIDSEKGYWEYVPNVHKGCLTRAPEPGTIVAKVLLAHGCIGATRHRAMTFRPCKPPRGE
jgi:hypothetical protein